MRHAGPSVTITSATNMLAFYFGSSTAIPALSDFCVFAAFCVLSLYLLALDYFLCFVAWDMKRVEQRKGECCGLFCCKEDTILCCKGYFLSPKQKKWSGLEKVSDDVAKNKDMKDKNSEENKDKKTKEIKDDKIEIEEVDSPTKPPV